MRQKFMLKLEYKGPGIPYSEVWIVSKKKTHDGVPMEISLGR